MAVSEFVDGDGWISDESSFYGDEAHQADLEHKAKRSLKRPYRWPITPIANKRMKLESESKPQQTLGSRSRHAVDVSDFLKSRPQITALEKAASVDRKSIKKQASRTANGEEAADILYSDRFGGDLSAWQQDETIINFLRRAPVADPATAKLGPWLWVSNPQISWHQRKHAEGQDTKSFVELGKSLLKIFAQRRLSVEAENPDKASATITRKMGPYRDQLEDDLLVAAVKTRTTCGKWMLFPRSTDLPRFWRLVAEATSEGKLGITSKVATYDPHDGKDETLICVYTYDFTDLDDARMVLEELVNLGLCASDGRPIYYKCDAYTYLDITSDNFYKLRASLLSSKEVFGNDAKVLKDGPIARLKKRNTTIDSFFSS